MSSAPTNLAPARKAANLTTAADLVEALRAGSRLALARLLTHVENATPVGREALSMLFPLGGHAHLVGVTGSPGTGKSSLVNRLAQYFRHPPEGEPRLIAILAVDPSSPFTGGAVLGDRVRMRDLAGDPGVFVRSMASRGALGGLSHTTAAAVQVLDAAGFDLVLIETVGAGQSEVDIARLAHTSIVIEAPGLGDDIQAIKAGILEIADILVVNKADRPGVENTERALRTMLDMAHPERAMYRDLSPARRATLASGETPGELEPFWVVPVMRTIATNPAGAAGSSGVADLALSIDQHRDYLKESGQWQVRENTRIRREMEALLRDTLMDRFCASIPEVEFERIVEDLLNRELSPHQAVDRLMEYGKPCEEE